eukprot:TRINITY_DN8539_c0_g2_i1.p1 TRINITY_DN8539_c0_g2~~TRINITY_DN8539_c0_g2_i1.p1  ORF type:complete len:765 (-),score=85.31 TRINITY_DN8539_c0_g2_i1:55-2349(-)
MRQHCSIRLVLTYALVSESALGSRPANQDIMIEHEDAGTLTVALLKEMFSAIHSTLQDQHESLKQQVNQQHEDLKQRVDMLMRRQEHFLVELRKGQPERAEWRASHRAPSLASKGVAKTMSKSSLLASSEVEHSLCTGLVKKLHRATEEFQILPSTDELIATVNELQQATGETLLGKADVFFDAKVKLQKYQAAIRMLLKESRESAHISGMQFPENGQGQQSLVEVWSPGKKDWTPEWMQSASRKVKSGITKAGETVAKVKGAAANITASIKNMLPNWENLKRFSMKAFTYFLEGRAYTLMEEARLISGEHFATNLYWITMALIQQAWELIPMAFRNWAPTYDGLTKILGYWIESRAKIAFADRSMKPMRNLMKTLREDYNAWLAESSVDIMNGILETVRAWFCRLCQSFGQPLTQYAPIFCDTSSRPKGWVGPEPEVGPEAEPGAGPEAGPEVGPEAGRRESGTVSKNDRTDGEVLMKLQTKKAKRSLFKRLVPSFRKTVKFASDAFDKFKQTIAGTVETVFYPLFFQVAVPIAANVRMTLSAELVQFCVSYLLEILLLTPGVNMFTGFIGDPYAEHIIRSYADTGLLPLIFESDYMDALEERIKGSFTKWLLKTSSFKTACHKWILTSFNQVQRLGTRAKNQTKKVESKDLEEDQACSAIDAPDICSEAEVLPAWEKALQAKGIIRTRDGSDQQHFYVKVGGKGRELKVSLDQRDCRDNPACKSLFEANGEGIFLVPTGCCSQDRYVCADARCSYKGPLPNP